MNGQAVLPLVHTGIPDVVGMLMGDDQGIYLTDITAVP